MHDAPLTERQNLTDLATTDTNALQATNPVHQQITEANNSPLRIVFVLPTYLPESFGGAEQQSRKLALALGRLGVHVTLIAPRLLRTTAKQVQDQSLTVRRFRLRSPPNLGGRHMGSFLAWSVKLLWWLSRHRRDYDLIHIVHGRLHAVPAVVAGSLLNKPTLIKIGRGGVRHFDLELIRGKRLFGRGYARIVVDRATAYVANSREIADDLRRWRIPESRIHRIPNGVDLPERAVIPRQDKSIRFVCLGRLDREKAIDLMIQGFARLPPEARVTLTIVGDGDCRDELERLVDELNQRDRVRFTGAVADVAPALRAADVFVSTSLSEGMSNALLEAMSFALMPLVSLVSGVADVIEDGRSGLLFATGDLDAFVTRLEETVALPPEERCAIGMAARATMADRYGIDSVAKLHVTLYNDLLTYTFPH